MAKQSQKFTLRVSSIQGNRIKPKTLRASHLAKIITTIDEALSGLVQQQWGDDFNGISIVSIKKGSVILEIEGTPKHHSAFLALSEYISNSSWTNDTRKQKVKVDHLASIAHELEAIIEFKNNKDDSPLATIQPKQHPAPEEAHTLQGDTSIYGTVISIAGIDKIRASIKTDSFGTIEFSCSEPMAKDLGKRYHEQIGISGVATWDTLSRRIVKFEPRSVLAYEERCLTESTTKIRTKFSAHFDEIEDISKFISEQREG